jgi:ABC-type uncharacterized transport system ATPase subunit
MTTTLLEPDSAILSHVCRADHSRVEPRVLTGQEPDLLGAVLDPEPASGMTEDDTVSVLEVLAEMQNIIDRYLEKTERQDLDR